MSDASHLTLKYHRMRRQQHQHQRTCVFVPFLSDLQGHSSSCLYSCSLGCQYAKAARACCPALSFCRHLLLKHDLALNFDFDFDFGPGYGLELEIRRLLQLKGSMSSAK